MSLVDDPAQTIPYQFQGSWHGQINDESRTGPYPGNIQLDKVSGKSQYHQKQGLASGVLVPLSVTTHQLVMYEDYLGPGNGESKWKLTLQIDDDQMMLECTWAGVSK